MGALVGRAESDGWFLRSFPATVLLTDLVLVVSAITFAAQLRERLTLFGRAAELTSEVVGGGVLVFLTLAWVCGIAIVGGYQADVFDVGIDEFKRVLRGSLLAAGMVGIACYLSKYDLSRGFFVIVFVVGILVLLLGRFVLRRLTHEARSRGHLRRRVLIAGSLAHADELALSLVREHRLGYDVIGVVVPAHDTSDHTRSGIPVRGHVEDLAAIAIRSGCEVVLVAGGAFASSSLLNELVWALESHRIQLVVAPSLTDVSGERVRLRPVDGLALINVEGPRGHLATRGGKRLFDLVGAVALVLLLSPLLVALAARVRLHDGGPALFRQVRTGRDGREFACLKFRTMVPNAEVLLARLHEREGHTAGLFKLPDDPRVTAPGRWMRRFSLDELPQLFNVLRGEMSLVGPRPPLPSEVLSYEKNTFRRLRVRPGMTGLWQVSGRSDLTWAETIRLDLYYVDNWSMLQDISILTRTLGAVLRPRGAY